MRREAKPADGAEGIDSEIEMRNLCYGSGVAFLPAGVGESDDNGSRDTTGCGFSPAALGGRQTGATMSLWKKGLQL